MSRLDWHRTTREGTASACRKNWIALAAKDVPAAGRLTGTFALRLLRFRGASVRRLGILQKSRRRLSRQFLRHSLQRSELGLQERLRARVRPFQGLLGLVE